MSYITNKIIFICIIFKNKYQFLIRYNFIIIFIYLISYHIQELK